MKSLEPLSQRLEIDMAPAAAATKTFFATHRPIKRNVGRDHNKNRCDALRIHAKYPDASLLKE